jgi:phage baseplate assembly protein W
MAYGAKNISYLDLRPSTGIGVKLPFVSPSVFTSVYTTKEQTKYNIINFLLTDKRERIMNPNFGAGLRSKLFEQISINTTDELEQSLSAQIENNFPNIEVIQLSVTGQPDYNSINIIFSYRIKSTSETDTANIVIQNM